MLDDLNDDTDKASDALQAVTKKTQELIKQSGASCLFLKWGGVRVCATNPSRVAGAGGMKNFVIIIVLVFVLLLLTYLVIMT